MAVDEPFYFSIGRPFEKITAMAIQYFITVLLGPLLQDQTGADKLPPEGGNDKYANDRDPNSYVIDLAVYNIALSLIILHRQVTCDYYKKVICLERTELNQDHFDQRYAAEVLKLASPRLSSYFFEHGKSINQITNRRISG